MTPIGSFGVYRLMLFHEPDVTDFSGILNDPAVTLASVEASAARAPFRPLRSLVVAAVAKRGKVSEDVAEKALAALEAQEGKSFLDLIRDLLGGGGGLEGLIRLILEFLPLFL